MRRSSKTSMGGASPSSASSGPRSRPSRDASCLPPPPRTAWHASAVAIAWVFAAYQVGYLIAVLVLLPLTDRVPAGRVMAGCAAASSTAFVLFPLLAHGVWSAAGLRLLAGLGLAGIYLP